MFPIRIGSIMTPNGMEYVCSVKGLRAHSVESLALNVARFLNEHCSERITSECCSPQALTSLFELNLSRSLLRSHDQQTRPLNIEEQQLFMTNLTSALYPII